MAQHIFICTNKGFVKSATFDVDSKTTTVEYAKKLRYAQAFGSKAAVAFMKKHNIEGFLYNPYEQEPVRDKYKVVKRSEFNIMEGTENSTQEYFVQKVMMEHDSDISFLQSGKRKTEEFMSFDEAKDKVIELNSLMVLELSKKIKVQVKLQPDELWKQD